MRADLLKRLEALEMQASAALQVWVPTTCQHQATRQYAAMMDGPAPIKDAWQTVEPEAAERNYREVMS